MTKKAKVHMKLKVIYEDDDILAIDKPAGIVIFSEGAGVSTSQGGKETLIDCLLEKYPDLQNAGEPPRYGMAHRLDKDTSGILLVAKNNKTFGFLQEQFKNRSVEKKYLALIVGHLENKEGIIETLIGRSPGNRKKQKIYLPHGPESKGKRNAITFYKVLKKFRNYDLVEAKPKTGRKHQIRAHFAYINHPIAGDKIYGFKNQPCPEGLKRQFLHASCIKIKLPGGKIKEIISDLSDDLEKALKNLNDSIIN